jgi:hypothetical protein
MPEDDSVDFVCGCDAHYKVVRVKAEASHAGRLIHCLVCKQPLAPTDGGYVLKYFLVGRPERGATSERSSALGSTISSDIENTVIAMWGLCLRT